ncbi:MAG: nitroreductase family deazaflavin-dependent oxidoreductase [Chloroflexales bacterium]|nr:nitroreductase family deazaflavin-dependent oxidoreductase [Chloroflexales bacterium]
MKNDSTADSTGVGAPPPRWVIKAMTHTHVFLHRFTGGRLFNTLGGKDVCFVTMTGAKSGRTLTIPLMYIPYQDSLLLVASQGSAPKNPAWYHNLVKNPAITVNYRDRRMKLRARLATPDEKLDLWPVCDQRYAPYADYRKRTTRDIPIFVCKPAP